MRMARGGVGDFAERRAALEIRTWEERAVEEEQRVKREEEELLAVGICVYLTPLFSKSRHSPPPHHHNARLLAAAPVSYPIPPTPSSPPLLSSSSTHLTALSNPQHEDKDSCLDFCSAKPPPLAAQAPDPQAPAEVEEGGREGEGGGRVAKRRRAQSVRWREEQSMGCVAKERRDEWVLCGDVV